jgi:tetratricopeptide (TPR) repeat protein
VDFAARRATPERLEKLRALSARLADVVEQIAKGVRTRSPERPVSPEDEKRYEELVASGVAMAEKGDLDGARQKLEAAVTIDPEEPSGLFNLGVLYGKLAEVETTRGDFFGSHVPDEVYAEKAVFCYERVLELDPKNARALTNVAAMYDLRGEADLAKDALKRALEIDPNETVAKEHLAELEENT